MKEEMKYLLICEMLNEAEKRNVWTLTRDENDTIVFEGEIDGEKVQIPAVEMEKKINEIK